MRTITHLRSFAGGELSPAMQGRVDSTAYQTGAARIRNMIPRPQGTVSKRPGTVHLGSTKFGTSKARLVPFTFSASQNALVEIGCPPTVVSTATSLTSTSLTKTGAGWTVNAYKGMFVECGGSYAYIVSNTATVLTLTSGWSPETPTSTLDFTIYLGYFRFHVDGVAVQWPGSSPWSSGSNYASGDFVTYGGSTWFARSASTSGSPKQPDVNPDYWYQEPSTGELELPHAYAAVHLFELTFTQSYDVMTFAHVAYRPAELRRQGAQAWSHLNVTFGAKVSAPTGVGSSSTPGVQLRIASIAVGSGGTSVHSADITTTTAHGLVDGDIIYIAGSTFGSLNGAYWAVATGSTYFSSSLPYRLGVRNISTGDWGPNPGAPSGAGGTIEVVPANSIRTSVYAVTSVDKDGIESVASPPTTATNNLFSLGAYNTVTWNLVTGAERYRVYKQENGLLGLVGEVDDDGVGPTFSFRDDNIAPDLGISPPTLDTVLSGSGNPAAVGYFEQRRSFGGTFTLPQTLWLTRTGTESDLTFHLPVRDDDRISVTLAALRVNRIRHLVPLNHLLVLTDSVEYRVSPTDGKVLTPTSIAARPQSYVGSSYVTPLVLHNTVLFVAARGNHVHELGYRLDADGFATGNVSLRAAHLFDNGEIVDAAMQKAPTPIAWFVTRSGEVLSLTYVPDEQVGAWALHTIGDAVESVCVLPEGQEDSVYFVVRRVVNGVTVRYLERLAPQTFAGVDAMTFLDCAHEALAVSAGSLTGLGHLAGEYVSIVADGIMLQPQTVTAGGAITLTAAYDRVVVGFDFTAELRTLPFTAQVPGAAQGNTRNLVALKARVVDSGVFLFGPDDANLVASDPPGESPSPYADTTTALEVSSRVVPAPLPGQWGDDDALLIQQPYPLPLTVVGIALEVALGGV